jgi:hypothetical protein
MIRWNLVQATNLILRRRKPAEPVKDPSQLYRQMVEAGLVVPRARKATGAGTERAQCLSSNSSQE